MDRCFIAQTRSEPEKVVTMSKEARIVYPNKGGAPESATMLETEVNCVNCVTLTMELDTDASVSQKLWKETFEKLEVSYCSKKLSEI